MRDTWNDSGTVFTALKMNVTDTASDASSLLLDLQVGGTSQFSVDKSGIVNLPSSMFIRGVSNAFVVSRNGASKFLSVDCFISNGARIYSDMSWGWSTGYTSSPTTAIWEDADNTIAQRNGVNPQEFRLYNTYTDASNYERGFMRWNSNVLEIGTEVDGTGTSRDTNILSSNNLFLRAGNRIITINNNQNITITNSGAQLVIDGSSIKPTTGAILLGSHISGGVGWASLAFSESSSDPDDPLEGRSVIWQSNGVGSGDDGDILAKITAGGVTKTITLMDFSTGTAGVGNSDIIQLAISDEGIDIIAGTGQLTFRMPYAMTLSEVRASVNTAPVGADVIVDINEEGTSILSTKLSIDAGEKTSTTAATPAVISDAALADDAEITIDVDQIGSTTAGKGLKITLIGTRA